MERTLIPFNIPKNLLIKPSKCCLSNFYSLVLTADLKMVKIKMTLIIMRFYGALKSWTVSRSLQPLKTHFKSKSRTPFTHMQHDQ